MDMTEMEYDHREDKTDTQSKQRVNSTARQMFFWFGMNVFDSNQKKYGGFNHFIAGEIFRWNYSYLTISLVRKWSFGRDKIYYDGYHHSMNFGCLCISYGT